MKKIILSAAFLAVAGFTSVKASEIKNSIPVVAYQDSTTKTPVELKDLPEAVQTTLKGDTVKDWTPTAAFLVTNADKSEYYLINVKKGEETGSLKIDKEGKVAQ
ncbi:hypothetical protein [Pedobacter sp. MC2016-24]|uniref:hypothetical protein n=1 Tax=Pedobacter sp. MC2016-24 TaxID=2780090 RepID=UPI00187E0681|nr:hypothetical protein [Pedobacter sp. MC2016-24]MBE9602964.1 hypothetical protein [Pedobacter sp. MC2016-24]